MALERQQIEHLEHYFQEKDKKEKSPETKWWKNLSKSRRYLKKQMNKYIRRQNKKIEEDEVSIKTNKKPCKGWEY